MLIHIVFTHWDGLFNFYQYGKCEWHLTVVSICIKVKLLFLHELPIYILIHFYIVLSVFFLFVLGILYILSSNSLSITCTANTFSQKKKDSFFKLIYLFLIGRWLLYNIVLVSAVYQHESALDKHMSPPSWASLPPPTPSHLLGCHRAPDLSFLSHTANFHRLSNFTYGNVYVSMLLSQFVPSSLSPTVSPCYLL